ncbi:hypothetical protein [Pseudonocardia sp. T1-2H]|uniref:hypothetical protein n=1 Tax=Pseudonocardia sp. T1-2H TaxID=3128899 RepID=UPI00310177AE
MTAFTDRYSSEAISALGGHRLDHHAHLVLGGTMLVGRVGDRAALHGFIARIEALGLELVELQRLAGRPAGGCAGRCPECGVDARAGTRETGTGLRT